MSKPRGIAAPGGDIRRSSCFLQSSLETRQSPRALGLGLEMIPLVDMHVHLLAGLDDGPRTDEEALAMCRLAYEEGVRMAAATAHQNERWSAVTPERIRQAAVHLTEQLHAARLPLTSFPCAEVMLHPDIESSWRKGEVLSVADRQQYVLVEMPHGLFVDPRATLKRL